MCCELSFKALSGNVYAQKTEPWKDPLVNNINRNEPVSDFFGYENKELSDRYVNGKFVGYAEDNKVAAEFNITKYVEPGKENLLPIEKYMLPYQDYAFKFVIRPVR